MALQNKIDCFGFYVGNNICGGCAAAKRCRAVLITHGFDILAEQVEDMLEALPADAVFMDSARIPELVEQLIHPRKSLVTIASQEEADLLDALDGEVKTAELQIDNL